MEDNKVQSPVQYPVQAIVSSDKKFGWNPVTRRYIIRTGPHWLHLLKNNIVYDPDMSPLLTKSPIDVEAGMKNVLNKSRSIRNKFATADKKRKEELAKSNEVQPAEKIIPTKDQIRNVARTANKIVKVNKHKLNKMSKHDADNQLRKLLIRKLEIKSGDRTMANLKDRISRVVDDLTSDFETTAYEDSSSSSDSDSD